MKGRNLCFLIVYIALLLGSTFMVAAQTSTAETQKSALQRRREAQERLQQMLNGRPLAAAAASSASSKIATPSTGAQRGLMTAGTVPIGINPAVDISLPNWSYSPNLRKFVNGLPGLGAGAANNLGQYIPVGAPDQTTYPGSDYYEIAVVEYREQMHSDLPPVVGAKTDPLATGGTQLRGYVQLNGGDPTPHYMGPVIVAQKNRPVRIKFINMLPIGMGGNLFIPVDKTVMGAGMGPMDMPGMPGMKEDYTQNRATLHLHGGLTPWISDGTPHQWTTPAGEMTSYPKGVSVSNVPDMPDPGPGAMTFFYTNQQSARLMFYHDHAYGITRLNVYAGEAAGYIITDQVEEDLIAGNISTGNPTGAKLLPDVPGYHNGIPLIIQDKSFVNDALTPPGPGFPSASYQATKTTLEVDPLWYQHMGATAPGGNLWFPHEYLPNENLFDPSGFWYMGRWDYGPWILPPMLVMNTTLPSPSHVPEAFMDTMVVNGTAFPYLEVPATPVRFRILNACNDRMLNLQIYKADPAGFAVTDATGTWGTEVKMVPAGPTAGFPDSWPKDGRDGGVPDPGLMGPDFWQIGNECGFLAKLAVRPAQPVNFDYDRTSATFGNVSDVGLFLPPAVRADVVVDLSGYAVGDTLILYNDAPAPMSLYDSRYDIFTDAEDWTLKGGAPPTAPGFGPNTRTIMQIRIVAAGTPAPANYLADLTAALPKAFAAAQNQILVPESAYNDAYGTAYTDVFANVADYTINTTGAPQTVSKVMTEIPGFNYTTPPTVGFYGGGAGNGAPTTTATAVASLNGVTGVALITGGSGYISAPTVTFTPAAGDLGTGATAQAITSGGVVTAIVMTNLGSNYLVAPTVTLSGGGAGVVQATAQALITLGSVGDITITNPGSGYFKAPYVYLMGGGGMGAAATAMLTGSMILDGKNMVEGMDMEFGRMNAVLGSTPSPLAPTVGAGPVIGAAFYIDPPTEILAPDQVLIWRLMHLGVDSHALHFHLFDVQVINRVDWTNTTTPPYDEEIGWKETLRTNPFEDIIVALRPSAAAMKLPFGLPDSNRLLDPTMPANTIGHFQPVLPPIGLPGVAQITNVMTNFGWEYVWHCHLLGHEENDMMRPIVLQVASTPPAAPVLTATKVGTVINCSWSDGTPFDYITGLPVETLGNPANEIGFRIQRANGASGGTFTEIGTALANKTTFEAAPGTGSTYRYRVIAYNVAGATTSNVVTISTTAPPAAPTNLTATPATGPTRVNLSWRDNAGNETGFVVERSTNAGAFVQIAAPGARTGTGNTVTYSDTTVVVGNTYAYRVAAVGVGGPSAYSNTATASLVVLLAPSNLVVSAINNGATALVTLNWTDNSSNETSFRYQRCTVSTFNNGSLVTYTVPANTVTVNDSPRPHNVNYYYRIQSRNASGSSAWVNATPFPILTP